jgi:hypothetical protein
LAVFLRGENFVAADCRGWQRSWNYGYRFLPERYHGSEVSNIDTVVALGIAADASAVMNGVIAAVSEDELERLDQREIRYEQVDVTSEITLLEGEVESLEIDRVVTYVPTPAPIADYLDARDRGTAGIEIRYWNLVNSAFHDLLPGEGERFQALTLEPDIPVVDVSRIE